MDGSARNGLCGLASPLPYPPGCSKWFGWLGVGAGNVGGALVWLSFWVSQSSPVLFPTLTSWALFPLTLEHLAWQSAEDSPFVPSMFAASEKEMASLWVSFGSLWADGGQGWLRQLGSVDWIVMLSRTMTPPPFTFSSFLLFFQHLLSIYHVPGTVLGPEK